MKRILGKLLFVVGPPVVAYGLLSAGAAGREHLGGRLLQIAGGFLVLFWMTGSFLLLGTFMSLSMGYRATESAPTTSCVETSPSRQQKKAEEAEA